MSSAHTTYEHVPHERPYLANNPQAVARLKMLARLMDAQFPLPGTNQRVGLDGLLGLIPGVGDLIGMGISGYIMVEARRMGVDTPTLIKMAFNVVIDGLVGAVPVFGDLFDFAFKANIRNLRLMGIEVGRR